MSLETFVSDNYLRDNFRTNTNFKISVFRPSMVEALEKYLYPALSQAFCTEIVNGQVTDTTVIDLARSALVCFASELYFNIGGVNVGPEGFSENVTQDTKPTRLEVISVAQEGRAAAGHKKMDILLEYLEKSPAESFQTWKDSEAYTILNEFPINSTAEFNKFCRIQDSRSIFLALRPAMQQAMLLNIQEVLDASEAATFSQPVQKTFDTHIKNALANYAYGYGVFDLATSFGFDTILSFSNLNASRQKGYEKVAKDLLIEIETRKFANANASVEKALQLIAANTPEADTPENEAYKNDPDSSVFYL